MELQQIRTKEVPSIASSTPLNNICSIAVLCVLLLHWPSTGNAQAPRKTFYEEQEAEAYIQKWEHRKGIEEIWISDHFLEITYSDPEVFLATMARHPSVFREWLDKLPEASFVERLKCDSLEVWRKGLIRRLESVAPGQAFDPVKADLLNTLRTLQIRKRGEHLTCGERDHKRFYTEDDIETYVRKCDEWGGDVLQSVISNEFCQFVARDPDVFLIVMARHQQLFTEWSQRWILTSFTAWDKCDHQIQDKLRKDMIVSLKRARTEKPVDELKTALLNALKKLKIEDVK